MTKYLDYLVVILFLTVIWLPLTATLTGNEWRMENVEFRKLSILPETPDHIDKLPDYFRKFDKYYRDNFGFRDIMAYASSYIQYRWLGVMPSNRVVQGENGWIFMAKECNEAIHSKEEMNLWHEKIEKILSYTKRNNIIFILYIIPRRNSIYAQQLPAEYNCPQSERRFGHLIGTLKESFPELHIVNTYPAIKKKSENERLYYVKDMHWNNTGALYGYRELALFLKQFHPSFHIPELSDYRSEDIRHKAGSISRFMNIRDDYQYDIFLTPKAKSESYRVDKNKDRQLGLWEYNREDEIYENPDNTLPRILVFHNSFFEELKPWLAENASRTYYKWAVWADYDLIKRENPDIIIQQILE